MVSRWYGLRYGSGCTIWVMTEKTKTSALPDFLKPTKPTKPLAEPTAPPWLSKINWGRVRVVLVDQLPRVIMVMVGFSIVAVGWHELLSDGTAAAVEKKDSDTVYSNESGTLNKSVGVPSQEPIKQEKIVVNVSGAVRMSGLYSFESTARIGEAIDAAGGLHSTADTAYVQKQLNLAGLLKDGDKVYVPYEGELELKNLLANLSDNKGNSLEIDTAQGVASNADNQSNSAMASYQLISINTASQAQLDELPGIGAARAAAIIEGRPYQAKDELVSRKVLGQSVYAQIEDLIGL